MGGCSWLKVKSSDLKKIGNNVATRVEVVHIQIGHVSSGILSKEKKIGKFNLWHNDVFLKFRSFPEVDFITGIFG